MQLELVPVGTHRSFGLQNDLHPRIGVNDAHGHTHAAVGLLHGSDSKSGRRGKSVHQASSVSAKAAKIRDGDSRSWRGMPIQRPKRLTRGRFMLEQPDRNPE